MSWEAAAIQAGGQIFSSLAPNLFGNSGPGFNEQLNNQKEAWKQHSLYTNYYGIQDRVAGAVKAGKEHGLHATALLGVQPSGGGSFSAGYDTKPDPDFASMGQGIARAANAYRTGVQRKLDDLALEKAQLSNDYLKVQIAGAQKAITNTGSIPSAPMDDRITTAASGNIGDLLKRWKSDRIGIDNGINPLHKIAVNQDGDPIPVLNTDVVGDNEIMMLVDYITTTLKDQSYAKAKTIGKGVWRDLKRYARKIPWGYPAK